MKPRPCPQCGTALATTAGRCGRCGFVLPAAVTQPGQGPAALDALEPPTDPPGPPADGLADPQQGVGTVVGVFDRQQAIATKLGIVAPKKRRKAEADAEDEAFAGGLFTLPESTVSRDFDATLGELRLFLARMGLVGRITGYLQSLVLVGVLLPWTRTMGVGQAAGIESLGWLPGGVGLLAMILHVLRYRRGTRLRPLLGFGALLLQAATLMALLWILRLNLLIEEMMRPELLWGWYWSLLAAVLALLGALVAMKDIGARR